MSKPFDFTDLEALLLLSQESSLNAAASRAALSPSAISKRLRNLENYAGVKLWNRSGRDILTRAGKHFLDYAIATLNERDKLRLDMQDMQRKKASVLRIVGNSSLIMSDLQYVLDKLHQAHPTVQIELTDAYLPSVVSAVAAGEADIGFTISAVSGEGLELHPYKRERIALALPFEHPRANTRPQTIKFAEAACLDLIGYEPRNRMQQILSDSAEMMGVKPRFQARVSNFDVACFVAAYTQIGGALVPESVAYRNAGAMPLKVIPLTDDWAKLEFALCMRALEDLSPPGKHFVSLIQQRFANVTESLPVRNFSF